MNKSKIQKFAVDGHKLLYKQIAQRAYQYGIEEGNVGKADATEVRGRILSPLEKNQRAALIAEINANGYPQTIERVTYIWFNRIVALRFMEVNNYLPSHIRVFSDASGAFKPEILNDVLHLEMEGLDKAQVAEYIENNNTEELYRYLLLTQCAELKAALPDVFGLAQRDKDYTELLFPNNMLHQDSFIGKVVSDIDEVDWGTAENWQNSDSDHLVQIIGWLYQYYNTELNAVVYDGSMSKGRIPKELLPAATTIYTTDWAIRYMVENSLGRLWLEEHTNAKLHDGWKYYLDEAEQEPEVEAQLAKLREGYKTIRPEEIKVIDPCMGSGHILVYAFDVLMQIYTSAGWDQREAAQSILKNNLYGLDIDDRAAQLAYFAVMMKARQYDRRLLTREIQPNIYAIHESNSIQAMTIEYFHKNDPKLKADIESVITEMRDAKEYGSILSITPVDFARLYARFAEIDNDIDMMRKPVLDELLPLVKCAELLAQKYDVVVTNPPYLGSSRFSTKLNDFVIANYPDVKADLSMVMYKHALRDLCQKNGFVSFITTTSWMFLSSFEKLRSFVLAGYDFESLVDFGTELFEGKVGHNPIVAWVNRKSHTDHAMTGIRLVDYCYSRRDEKETEFFNKRNYHYPKQSNFSKIPGSPVAYWVSDALIRAFETGKLVNYYAKPRQGMSTCDVNRFSKLWYEVIIQRTNIPNNEQISAWVKYNKGGSFRKWYGNREYIVYWGEDGEELLANGALLRNREVYLCSFLAWTKISSAGTGFRTFEEGFLFDGAGGSLFLDSGHISKEYLLGLLNSNVVTMILNLISPTLNFNENHIGSIPVIESEGQEILRKIDDIVISCVHLSTADWDSYETSWDFKRNPLV